MKSNAPYLLLCSRQYVTQAITLYEGAMATVIAPISIGLTKLIEILLKDSDIHDLAVPIAIEAVLLLLFSLVTTADFLTGMKASKRTNERKKKPLSHPIGSGRMYKTAWKFLGVVLITGMLTTMAVFAELLRSEWIYNIFIWLLIWFWLLVHIFEWKSIGENLRKIDGKKPELFMFIDNVVNVTKKSSLKRIEKTISGDVENTYSNDYKVEDEEIK